MRKRLLVTGGNGFVAGSVIAQGLGSWEIHALSRGCPSIERPNLFWHQVPITDPHALGSAFSRIKPAAVIHAAAIADIDYSQAHRDEARQVNVVATRHLADLCRKTDTRLVFTSTDTVFDGLQGGYVEDDPPRPVNFYGETKAEAERIIAKPDGNGAIARLALVMGLPVIGQGNSFLARMIASLKEGRKVGVPPEEIRTPIDVITLGRALLELAGNDVRGVIHLAGNDVLNPLDMVKRIAIKLGYPPELIVPSDVSKIPNRAPRPRDVSLNNAKARNLLKTPMLGLDEAVRLIMTFKHGGESV